MTTSATRQRDRLRQSVAPFLSFFSGPYSRLNRDPDISNFAVGNPQEMPLPSYVEALQRNLEPQDKDWFAYKLSRAGSRSARWRRRSPRGPAWRGIPPTWR